MPRRSILALALALALLVVAGSVAACDQPVGRICDLGVAKLGENTEVIGSPSLDCESRMCLKVKDPADEDRPAGFRPLSANKGLCSATCESDTDCDKVPESPCATGFTCSVAVTAGPFCCQKVCICKDYLVLVDGEVETPAACDGSNPANTCCNLEGRPGNRDYPNCPAD